MKVPCISLKLYYSLFISSTRRTHKSHRDNVHAANGRQLCINCKQHSRNYCNFSERWRWYHGDISHLAVFRFISSLSRSPFSERIPCICLTVLCLVNSQSHYFLSFLCEQYEFHESKNWNGDFWIILWFLSCVPVGEFNLTQHTNNIEQSTISTINILRIVFIASCGILSIRFVLIILLLLFHSAYLYVCRWYFVVAHFHSLLWCCT